MYTLEFRTTDDWSVWQDGLGRDEAIALLYGAQVADVRDEIARYWRITPNPWQVE